jgi:hypothetical protein
LQCPSRRPHRFVGPVIGALSPKQEADRIAAMKIKQPLTLAQFRELLRRSWRLGSQR